MCQTEDGMYTCNCCLCQWEWTLDFSSFVQSSRKTYISYHNNPRIETYIYFICRLLYEKRKELGDAANKLKNGLFKIDETREKVEKMSVELEDAKTKVAQFQKQCEEYLVVIVQQKREADEQQKVMHVNYEYWY